MALKLVLKFFQSYGKQTQSFDKIVGFLKNILWNHTFLNGKTNIHLKGNVGFLSLSAGLLVYFQTFHRSTTYN